MTYSKYLFTAIVTSITCLAPTVISQRDVSARPLFPSASESVAQQPQSSSAMMVQLPQIEVNLELGSSSEIMGQLTVPLQLKGQTIPVGSIVRLAVVPTDNGDAILVADTIIIPSNGMTISVLAEGSAIPGERITDRRGADVGKETSAIGSYLGERVGLALGGDAEDAIQVGSGAGLVGAVGGLLSPSKRQVVRLVQGVYFLDLY